MFLATANKNQRLLLLTYIGHVGPEDLKRGRAEAAAVLDDLQPGFRILADFERLDAMDPDSATEIGKLMELADQREVGMIVRVIPDPSKDIGLNILARFHYKQSVPTVTCETMAEAAQALEL
jgi:hypothetical protein